jgi:Chalcone isomerase-like
MSRRMILALVCSVAGVTLAIANPAQAAPPVSVVAEQGAFPVNVSVGGQTLSLNGTGTRYKAIFRVYDAGLYTSSPVHGSDEFFALKGAKKLHLVARRDIPANELARMLVKGVSEANSQGDVTRQLPGIALVGEMFASRSHIKTGESFGFEFVPGVGTQLMVNAKPVGEPIRDPGFFAVVMRLWLGPTPVDAPLKAALLGQQADYVRLAEMH